MIFYGKQASHFDAEHISLSTSALALAGIVMTVSVWRSTHMGQRCTAVDRTTGTGGRTDRRGADGGCNTAMSMPHAETTAHDGATSTPHPTPA